jgi:hypothetical protein
LSVRVTAIVVILAALAFGVAVAVSAQGPVPSVTVTASETTLNVGVSGPLAAGPTRFEIVKAGRGPLEIAFGALRPGVTLDRFTTALRGRDPEAAIGLVHLDGGASLFPRERRRAVTFRLRPNTTYVVVNLTGGPPSDWEVASFAVGGQPNGAAAPRADARVRMIDFRFRGATTLPRRGVLRFDNAGRAPHFALAMPLRRGASRRTVGAALRRNSQRRLRRLVDFRSQIEPQALVTRGAVNYNEVRFPRRGRYVMVCFFEGHNRQGMYRFVRVR